MKRLLIPWVVVCAGAGAQTPPKPPTAPLPPSAMSREDSRRDRERERERDRDRGALAGAVRGRWTTNATPKR